MDKIKKFTCLKHEGEKADGAIEGSKRQVLAWMKKTFPGLSKAEDQEMMPAWQFFYKGDSTTYETADGMPLYLVEMEEEDNEAEAQMEEKKLEASLKNYREYRSKQDSKAAKAQAAAEKMMDEEVAEEVAKAIWDTAHMTPREQDEKLSNNYTFWWVCMPSVWPIADMFARLIHDEAEAKDLLCHNIILPHFHENDDNGDILATWVREGKFIHFQMTPAFDGGMDAYIVFRKPKTRDAVIIRFCK